PRRKKELQTVSSLRPKQKVNIRVRLRSAPCPSEPRWKAGGEPNRRRAAEVASVYSARETLRLHQANERTMLAWIRTSIALMAFGFALERASLLMLQLAAFTPAQPTAQNLGS